MNMLNQSIRLSLYRLGIIIFIVSASHHFASAQESTKGVVQQVPLEDVLRVPAKKIAMVLPKYSSDLRSSLRLIVHAYDVNTVEKVALSYYEFLQADKNNAKLMAEYAFAHQLSGENSNLKNISTERSQAKSKLQRYPYNQAAEVSRVKSLKLLDTSPEVLVMASAQPELAADYTQAMLLVKKAIALDPEWGYAHYRAGKLLIGLMGKELIAAKRQTIADSYARQALQEFGNAQRLDSTISGRSVASGYAHAYCQLKQYDKALIYLNQVIVLTNKTDASRSGLLSWRQQLVAHKSSSE